MQYIIVLTLSVNFLGIGALSAQEKDLASGIEVQDSIGVWHMAEDTTSSPPMTVPIQEPGIYNYRTWQRYLSSAVVYEDKMLNRLNATQKSYDKLNDRLLNADESEKTFWLDSIKITQNSLEDDRRVLAYARKLIKRILRIGKDEKYHKLARLYVPGMDERQALSQSELIEASAVDLPKEETTDAQPTEGISQIKGHKSDRDITFYDSKPSTPFYKRWWRNTFNIMNFPVVQRRTINWASDGVESQIENDCSFEFKGTDPLTGEERRMLKPEMLFTHTDQHLRGQMKSIPFVSCNAGLSSVAGGYHFLTLTFDIYSAAALQVYGYIPKGSPLNLMLIDGSSITLSSPQVVRGIYDKHRNQTRYVVTYPLDYQVEKKLRQFELDAINVVWSTGYERFQVFNVDLILQQLNCLNL